MILRIEDTDAERNKPELVNGILEGLQWLGVDWDEGPFYQSQRTALYLDAARKLLASGAAFLCYCPAEKYVGGDHAGCAGAPAFDAKIAIFSPATTASAMRARQSSLQRARR